LYVSQINGNWHNKILFFVKILAEDKKSRSLRLDMSAFFSFELEPPPWMYRLLARGPLMQRLYHRLAADLAEAVPLGGLLVDVGAGPGHLMKIVAGKRPDLRLAVLDRSWAMLHPSRQQLEPDPKSRSLLRLVGDVTALPVQAACCDLAVATFSFHTWNNPVLGVREMLRLVKPGGRIWIYEMNREATWEELRALAREESLPGFFVAAGFKLLSWNHALRAGDFAATFEQAHISGWELSRLHHLFWRAASKWQTG
jgi:SAM-dependent methyltransferase